MVLKIMIRAVYETNLQQFHLQLRILVWKPSALPYLHAVPQHNIVRQHQFNKTSYAKIQ